MSKKVLALLSGGLDSLLAAKLIMNQGLHIEGINFFTGFSGVGCVCIKREDKSPHDASWVANQLGIKLHVVDVVNEFKEVLVKPQYGYGANLNPCLDCKRFMVMQAFAWMKKNSFDFLVTGEVVGQRPMSQLKHKLPIVAKDTEDLLLRPLSAKLLPSTLPEREGWIDRESLCAFSGRGRKPQIALAQQFGFDEYPQPAGGCVLTDESYTKRVKDLWQQQGNKNYTLDDIMLFQVGRHLRLRDNFKIIVGRDRLENECLEKYQDRYVSMYSVSHIGPRVLCVAKANAIADADVINLAAQVTAYFGKGRQAETVQIMVHVPQGESQQLTVAPIAEIPTQWYI